MKSSGVWFYSWLGVYKQKQQQEEAANEAWNWQDLVEVRQHRSTKAGDPGLLRRMHKVLTGFTKTTQGGESCR